MAKRSKVMWAMVLAGVLVMAGRVALAADVSVAYHDGTAEKTQTFVAWWNDGPHGTSANPDNSLMVSFDTSQTGLASVTGAYIKFWGGAHGWDWSTDPATGKFLCREKPNLNFDLNGKRVSYTIEDLASNYGMPWNMANGFGIDDTTTDQGWVQVPVDLTGVNLNGTTTLTMYLLYGDLTGWNGNAQIAIGVDTNAATRNSARGSAFASDKNTLCWAQSGVTGEYAVSLVLVGNSAPSTAALSYHDGTAEKTQTFVAWWNDGPHGTSGNPDNSLMVSFNTSETGLANVTGAYIKFWGGAHGWDWSTDPATGKFLCREKPNLNFDLNGKRVSYTIEDLASNYGMPWNMANGFSIDDTTTDQGWVQVPVDLTGVNLNGTTTLTMYFLYGDLTGWNGNAQIAIGVDTNAATRNSARGNADASDKTSLCWAQSGVTGEYAVSLVLVGNSAPPTARVSYHDGTAEKTQMFGSWYNDGPHGPAINENFRDNSLVVAFDTSQTGLTGVTSAYIKFWGRAAAWDWTVDAATGKFYRVELPNLSFDVNGHAVSYTLDNLISNYGMPYADGNGIGMDDTMGSWVQVPVNAAGVDINGMTILTMYFLNGGFIGNASVGIGVDTDAATRNSARGTWTSNDKTTLCWQTVQGNPAVTGEYLVSLVLVNDATAVTFNPPSGTFNTPQSVVISCNTSGATIRYTTNGTDPSESNGTSIASGGSVSVSDNLTLKALAWVNGVPGNIQSAAYSFVTAMPTFSPGGQYISGPKSITISCATPGATIRYTTNGTDPSASNGTIIASGGSVSVNNGMTLKARAWRTNYGASAIASVTYTMPSSYDRPATIPYNDGVTVDGDLSDWADATWVPLDQKYDGDNASDVGPASFAARWGSSGTKVYVAVRVQDYSHALTNTYTSPIARDAVEIYLHTTGFGSTNYYSLQDTAQQYVVGIMASNHNQVWTSLADKGLMPDSAGFQAAGKVDGDDLCYEVAMTPFEYFGGISGQASVVSILSAGDVIGLDVVVASNDGSNYTGMRSENTKAGKSTNWSQMGLHQCTSDTVIPTPTPTPILTPTPIPIPTPTATPTPTTAPTPTPTPIPGDANHDGAVTFADFAALQNHYGQSGMGWAEGDFNGDGRVTFEDFSILQNHYGETRPAGGAPDAATAATGIPCSAVGLFLLTLLGLSLLSLRSQVQA